MQNESVVVKFWAGNPRNNLMVNTYTLNTPSVSADATKYWMWLHVYYPRAQNVILNCVYVYIDGKDLPYC